MTPPDPITRAGQVVRQFVDAWDLPLDAGEAAALGAYILEWFDWRPNDPHYPRTRPGAPRGSTPPLPLNPEDLDVIVVMVLSHAPTDLPMDRVADLVAQEIAHQARGEEELRTAIGAVRSPDRSG